MKITFLSLLLVALVAVVSACNNKTVHARPPIEIPRAKSKNYIVQIKPQSILGDFLHKMENLFEHILEEIIVGVGEAIGDAIGDAIGGLIPRDNDDELEAKRAKLKCKFKVHTSYDIGGTFKAVSIKVGDDKYLDRLTSLSDITAIIPDDEIQFDLPVPEKQKIDKRYYIRHVVLNNSSYQDTNGDNKSMAPVSASYSANTTGWTSSISPTASSSGHKSKATALAAVPEDDDDIKYLEQSGSDTPWNLVRVSEREKDYSLPYIYDENAGKGVTVYVVDDGINIEHKDFEGRAKYGWSSFNTKLGKRGNSSQDKTRAEDGGGHGTHVAGIIAGKHYGVAKKANLVSVQVLNANGRGTISSLLGGVQWVMQQAKNSTDPVVVNMSLGVPSTMKGAQAFDEAVQAAVDAGIPIIAAAGNSASDACDIVPGRNKQVYTVGSTTQQDEFDPASCFGSCLNILAPGFDVTSAYVGSDTAFATLSGTSMAAPHVSGVAALLLPHMGDKVSPKDLYKALDDLVTADKIKNVPDDTPNLLLFNGQTKTGNSTKSQSQ